MQRDKRQESKEALYPVIQKALNVQPALQHCEVVDALRPIWQSHLHRSVPGKETHNGLSGLLGKRRSRHPYRLNLEEEPTVVVTCSLHAERNGISGNEEERLFTHFVVTFLRTLRSGRNIYDFTAPLPLSMRV